MSEPRMSYSQGDEEKYIVEAVGDLGVSGSVLDIGAWHPTDKSNSRRLIELGFIAVLVEPSPEPFLSLLKAYGGNDDRSDPGAITLICAAVTLEPGLVKLHATADAVSTTSEAWLEKWRETGGFYGSFLTPAITMEDIFSRYGNFDFVNIDAEGVSVDLFMRMLDLDARPKCCCVEIDAGRHEELEARSQAEGYRIVYENSNNAVMVLS